MWKKKLKSKKRQFVLIGVMLGIISMVLSSCMIFFMELNTYASNRFSEKYCPDAYVYSLGDISIEGNFSNSEVKQNIEEVLTLEGKNISVPLKHGSQNISSITSMFCSVSKNGFERYITPLEGDVLTKKEPGDGEVWIVSTLALSYDIAVGDVISVQYAEPVELKVTGIYSSTYAPSERLTIMANIVNQNTLDKFPDEEQAAVMAVNLKDSSENKLNQLSMENPKALMTMGRDMLMSYVTKIQGVVGIVSAAAAFIVFIASLLIIRFILNVDIGNELVSIGIYKSLGYSDSNIIQIYMRGYLFIGAVSMLCGIGASIGIASYLCNATTKVLGLFRLSITTLIVCLSCFTGLMIILQGALYLSLQEIKRLSPVELLVSGRLSGKEKIGKSFIKNAKTPLQTSINDMFKHKKTSVLTLLILSVSFYLLLFFGSSYYSCANMYQNANLWVACPKFEVVATGNVSEEISAYSRESEFVDSAICGNCFYYPAINIPEYSGNSRNIDFYVFEDTDESITGVKIQRGRNPVNPDEIAVSDMLLKLLGKKVGEKLTLVKDGAEVTYQICGSFASMESLTIYMTINGMRQIFPDYKPGICFINLKEDASFEDFKRDVEERFPGISIDNEWSALKYAMEAIENMLTKVMLVLLIIFSIFAVVGVVNILALTIHNKKRQYGILMSMGFSQKYIIQQNLWYITIMIMISFFMAIVLHLGISKTLFKLLVIDALMNSVIMNVGLLAGITVIIYLIIYSISKKTSDITPVFLMES